MSGSLYHSGRLHRPQQVDRVVGHNGRVMSALGDTEGLPPTLSGGLNAQGIDELLTVDDVAALLKVSKSWVYEHTRSRGKPRSSSCRTSRSASTCALMPARCVRSSRSNAEQRDSVPGNRYNRSGLNHEEPTGGKGVSRMARTKRQYGSGCLLKRGRGWAIRWRELEIAPDGTTKTGAALRNSGRDVAPRGIRDPIAESGRRLAQKAPTRSRVTFRTLANEWQATVLPMYKHSTQKHRRFMLKKHLLPRFGDTELSEITRQEVQMYVAHLTQEGIRTEVHRSHSRCAERGSPDRGEMGAPSGQSCARRRLAKAQDGSSEVGADAAAGRGVARRAAAAGTNDGWAGDPLGAAAWRTVRAALARHRRARAGAHSARSRLRWGIRHAEDGSGTAADPAIRPSAAIDR